MTFAQAQERAEEWINGDLPTYQHREVRVREFELGFVVWAEDREGGPTSDGGRQRLVIARDSGEATLWPGLPVGEVIRRYEEEYAVVADAAGAAVPAPPPARVDLNQTSFLLTPPEWLQDAADRIGLPAEPHVSQESGSAVSSPDASPSAVAEPASPSVSVASSAEDVPDAARDAGVSSDPAYEPTAMDGVPSQRPSVSVADPSGAASVAESDAPSVSDARSVSDAPGADAGASAAEPGPVPFAPPAGAAASGAAPAASPWVDANASAGGVEGVPLPATVFAPPLSGADDEDTPPPSVGADAPTAL
ncbi:SUKH-4 family immunity protein, partial [Streptomyces sp. NPDC003327]